jgi:hypothetical protein
MQCAIGTEEKFERNLGLLPIPFKIIQRHHRIVCFGGFFSSLLVIEASMAHQVKGIERHYLRTTFFEQRMNLMAAWAAFASALPSGEDESTKRRAILNRVG